MKKYYIDTDIISKRFFVFKASDCLTDEEWKEKGFKHYDKEDFNIIVPINAPQSVYLRYPCSSKYIKIVSDIATKKAILEKERINNILVNLKNGDHILCKAQGYEGYVYFIKEDGKFISRWNSSNRYDGYKDVVRHERIDEVIKHIHHYGIYEKLSDIVSWL